jgi:predicted MFS family arabinose efflux permease
LTIPVTGDFAPTTDNEWRDGWRIVLACSLASGTGVILLFFSFSLFALPIMAELKLTRGELGTIQSLVVAGALGAPLIGQLTDRFGFRVVFLGCTAICFGAELLLAFWTHDMFSMSVSTFLLGFFGVGTTALTSTRPVNAHFRKHRGKALGLVVAGLSLATILVPAPLESITAHYGWRWAVVSLGVLALSVSLPAVLLILPRSSGLAAVLHKETPRSDHGYLKDRSFLLLAGANIVVGAATSGFVAQLSPILQAEGITAAVAAVGLSAYATGQLIGRLGGGALLDLFPPRRIAVLVTLFPGAGFALLFATQGSALAALAAAAMIGLLAGAELDLSAFFVARLFPLARYSTIYGALNAIGWLGNAAGIIGVGLLHDRLGSYAPAQALALVLLTIGAAFYAGMREQPAGFDKSRG